MVALILRKICYQRMFVGMVVAISVMLLMYHNMLQMQFRRIVSQRMYIYGYTHNLHGHHLQENKTYSFAEVLHQPTLDEDDTYYILVLISSSPHNRKHSKLRDSIRTSWGNCEQLSRYKDEYIQFVDKGVAVNCKLFFYMGLSDDEELNDLNIQELQKYNDVIIGDFKDSYFNMTSKILFVLNWVLKNMKMKYILKTDDDIFMNIPKLIAKLNTKYKGISRLYGGNVYFASVVRDKKHRHYLTRDEFPDDWYPPYNKGSQLVISGNLLEPLMEMSTRIKRFQIDDAYIGLVMNHIKVLPTRIKEFTQNQWVNYFVYWISSCDLKHMIGIGDDLTPEKISYIHSVVHKDSIWFCFPLSYLFYYIIFLIVLLVLLVLLCRDRYCPWLTGAIVCHSLRIFYKKLKALR